jgi:GNAT superfamily N-acetyltransferase
MRAQEFISEISDEQLQRYLDRAGRRVDARQERMSQARERLNKGYEIYHAETPDKIVHRFDADTPAEAKRYYDDFITKYESDVDYELSLRRATGIMEDSENYGGIQLSLEIQKDDTYVDDDDTDNQVVFVKATSNGRELGHVLFTMSYDGQGLILNPQDLEVDERYRGQGIAQTMYDFVKSKGYRIRRSGQQTDAGAAFWQKHRPEQNIWENFADGKVKGKSRPGRVKRAGASCNGSVTDLRKRAKNASGEKAKMYHWCANMKSGRKK